MKTLLTTILSFSFLICIGQDMTGSELLDKTISFHDSNGKWSSLAAKVTFEPEERDGKTINRFIEFKDGGNYFRYYKNDGEIEIDESVNSGECTISLNGKTDISDEDKEKYRLTCDRVKWIRDYYVYLYGLPMKLKDKGTNIDEKVTEAQFMGVNYLKLRVTYEAEVGKDIWYFYINPETYEMTAYQFFHDENKGDGEYITLEGTVEIDGIKIPKKRTWITNKEDKLLGVDDIAKIEKLN